MHEHKSTIKAIALDAFGTLIQYTGARHIPYRRFLEPRGNGTNSKLPFLMRNVPARTFANELGLDEVMSDFDRELAEELQGLSLFPEVFLVLKKAGGMGLRVAVCSNLAFEYGATVRSLLPDLDTFIFSYEVGIAKPEPAIYAATCRSLRCQPHEVVFVGDSLRCDYHGPRRFGMQARWLDRGRGQTLLDALAGIL